jgi:hypothetical protein
MKPRLISLVESVGSYLLIGLLFLGLIIIYGVSRASVFNWTYFLVGLGLIAIPGLILFLLLRTTDSGNKKEKQNAIKAFKRNADVIEVNLSECVIKSNSWTEEKERYSNYRVQAWNTLGGDSEKNIEKVTYNSSTITYKTNYKGQEQIFESGTVGKDEITVSMLLEHQGKTKIYIDRLDPDNYYFDLEFLRN